MSAMHHDQAADRLSLRIEGSLTIADVTPLRVEMLAVLSTPPRPVKEVVLDLHAVGEADSAGVQLLTSAALWLQALQIRPVLSQVSHTLDHVARAIGAADERQCCGFERLHNLGDQP